MSQVNQTSKTFWSDKQVLNQLKSFTLENRMAQVFIFSWQPPAFFWLVFQPLISVQTSFFDWILAASGLDYLSLIAAAYPTWQRSNHEGVELAGVLSNGWLIHLSRWKIPADWTGVFNWKVKELNPRSRLQQSKHNTAVIPNSTFMDKMTSKISLEISTKKLFWFNSRAKLNANGLIWLQFSWIARNNWNASHGTWRQSQRQPRAIKASDGEMERVRYFWVQTMTGLELLCSV